MKAKNAKRFAWIISAIVFASLACAYFSNVTREGFSRFFELATQAPIEDDAIFVSTDADLLLGSAYRNLPNGYESTGDSVPYEELEDLRMRV